MKLDSKYFDKVRVKPGEERLTRGKLPPCEWPGCPKLARHRAPKGRSHEGEYHAFCLEHVQAYNKSYNYFEGMKDKEIADWQKDALTGHRPTWRLGENSWAAHRSGQRAKPGGFRHTNGFRDPFGFLGESHSREPHNPSGRRIGNVELKALHTLGLDEDYLFNRETTLAILAGFAYNRRVMITGYHGTGKSTHIEQVASRLNWPCVRVNLDSHISRIDLIGKDAIVLKDGKQVTEFREGILPWAYQNNVALVFDEYDAGRPDVMFVIQRILESSGRLTLLDQSRVIRPHPCFRLFSTANTVGLGDTTGLYHGTQQINQAQMARWSIVAALN